MFDFLNRSFNKKDAPKKAHLTPEKIASAKRLLLFEVRELEKPVNNITNAKTQEIYKKRLSALQKQIDSYHDETTWSLLSTTNAEVQSLKSLINRELPSHANPKKNSSFASSLHSLFCCFGTSDKAEKDPLIQDRKVVRKFL